VNPNEKTKLRRKEKKLVNTNNDGLGGFAGRIKRLNARMI